MPKALLETRKNVRHDIRPFYLVEVVLDKQIKYLRKRDVPLLAMEIIYDFLSYTKGPLTSLKPKLTSTSSWVTSFKEIIATYKLDDVYNADESGLFLQTTSNWTLDTQRTSGTKSCSSRVSILFCTNATGSENLPFGFRQNEELQNMAEVQPWNTRPQKARDYDNKDAVVAQEARAAGDVHANNQATEPRPKAKRTDYMIFQQSLAEEDSS
ncbi:hypothetical protein BGZ58_007667 [Dissophora ornata]|nr:hypothetical protein BGZ58_007667 [Dissophora ornata]